MSQTKRFLPRLPHVGPFFASEIDRRNYWYGVANGVLLIGADNLTEAYLVLTLFVSFLTDSKFIVGLVAPFSLSGWYLPQLLVSGAVQRRPRKMPVFRLAAALRLACWVAIASMLWFVRSPIVILACLLVLIFTMRLADGISGLAFMDIVGKVIHPRQRGAFLAMRMLLGGVLALGASAAVGVVLGNPAGWRFPLPFALLFSIYAVLLGPGLFLFTMVDEPAVEVAPRESGVSHQMRRAAQVLGENASLRLFLVARILMVIASMALPFYIIFARERMHAADGLVGVYLGTLTLAGLLSNIWVGRICDRLGNRHLLLISCLVGLAAPVLALVFGWLRVPPVLFALVFALNGVFIKASDIAHTAFLLDVSPPDDRPLYVGVANTLVGVGVLASSLGGALAQWLGMDVLLAVASVAFAAATMLSYRMTDPRRTSPEWTG